MLGYYMMVAKIFIIAALVVAVTSQRVLESYEVNPDAISVSGVGAGGSFASQFHVAYSNDIMGAGTIAAAPYYCAEASSVRRNQCEDNENVDVASLVSQTLDFESDGFIDGTANLRDTRVWMLHGSADSQFHAGLLSKVNEYYLSFMPQENIMAVSNLVMEHGFPTIDYGNICDSYASPFIQRCSYNGAFEMLDFLYGENLVMPSSSDTPGDWYEFDQSEFFDNRIGIAETGWIYVPSFCMSKDPMEPCALHVHMHQCEAGDEYIEDDYAAFTYLNQVGETNNIIILYPQAERDTFDNPDGCFDWWGLTDGGGPGPIDAGAYATNEGPQMQGVKAMIDRISGV